MSAKFIWVRNPTAINGLATTYVSLRGSDTNGDGTAQNPYRSLAKATTVAAATTNVMIDDGDWNEARIENKGFYWYGNSKTHIKGSFAIVGTDIYNYLFIQKFVKSGKFSGAVAYNCIIINLPSAETHIERKFTASNCLIFNAPFRGSSGGGMNGYYYNCILRTAGRVVELTNCIVLGSLEMAVSTKPILINCNLGTNNLNSPYATYKNCINNASVSQTFIDYFNTFFNITTEIDFLACDFTAKPGSANIGAGINGSTIGFNQGYPARATNDSNDIFAAANGATLRNVAWNATLNGYSLVHKDKVCAGYTVNTITLAADAEATDDYYNGLFIGITAGDGAGEIHRIVDYDGATRVATIDTSWQSAISTSSVYSISGTIDSATKDFGRVIKVKRNWAFLANMQSWTDPNVSSYGMWKEFLTSPLQNNGEWMMRPCSNFRYEYSIDGTEWHSSTELLACTDSDTKTDGGTYGNASESYVAANAKTTVLRYVRYHIEIGFNIGEDA